MLHWCAFFKHKLFVEKGRSCFRGYTPDIIVIKTTSKAGVHVIVKKRSAALRLLAGRQRVKSKKISLPSAAFLAIHQPREEHQEIAK